MRAEDARGTPIQSHISPSILVYEDKTRKNTPNGLGAPYRGTSLTRKRTPLGPYSKTICRVIWWSKINRGVGRGAPVLSSSSVFLSSLELSDTKVYEP